MPELPEVETIRRQLEREIKGSRFLSLSTSHPKSFQPSFEVVKKNILGRKIRTVGRRAKLLIFDLAGPKLLLHLKLTGRLLVRKSGEKPDEYTRSVFTLKTPKGKTLELRFADSRKFGLVKIVDSDQEMNSILAEYGPEPFDDLTLIKFVEVMQKSNRAAKTILLDQKKISGLGNIYANDALWLAKTNPRILGKNLKPGQIKKLYRAILTVLKRGLKYGGASDQWYLQVHGEKGKYQEHFLVYGRHGQKCWRCQETIKRIVVNGRGTFFCPKCQA